MSEAALLVIVAVLILIGSVLAIMVNVAWGGLVMLTTMGLALIYNAVVVIAPRKLARSKATASNLTARIEKDRDLTHNSEVYVPRATGVINGVRQPVSLSLWSRDLRFEEEAELKSFLAQLPEHIEVLEIARWGKIHWFVPTASAYAKNHAWTNVLVGVFCVLAAGYWAFRYSVM